MIKKLFSVRNPFFSLATRKGFCSSLQMNPSFFDNSNEFKQAEFYFRNSRFRISLEFYERVLDQLEISNQLETDNYIYILKKVIKNEILLKQYKPAETYLEKIIEVYQKRNEQELVYKHYNNLILHMMRTNLNKALKICKLLNTEKEKSKIPLSMQKNFLFHLGTAYLVKGNLLDAKRTLKDFFNSKLTSNLEGFALNNIAVAYWWRKNPNYRDFSDSEEESEADLPKKRDTELQLDNAEKDFKSVLSLLKLSIYSLENIELLSEGDSKEKATKLLLKDFSFKSEEAYEGTLSNKNSQIPLINILEFIYFTAPDKESELIFWTKIAAQFFQKCETSCMDRFLLDVALFCKNSSRVSKAEALFRKVLLMLEDSDSANKALCLLLYGRMLRDTPDRTKEGEKLIAQSYEMSDKLPYWCNRLSNILIPELDLS